MEFSYQLELEYSQRIPGRGMYNSLKKPITMHNRADQQNQQTSLLLNNSYPRHRFLYDFIRRAYK